MFRTNTKMTFIRRVLYSLKRDYGLPMDIYQILSTSVDSKTGKRIQQKRKIEIRKAVLLPTILTKKFSYDLSYIAANKNFTYGGQYDVNTRLIIIEDNDIPPGVEIKTEDYVVIDNKRYEVKTVDKLEHEYGYVISAKETVGALPYQQMSLSVGNELQMEQRAEGVI